MALTRFDYLNYQKTMSRGRLLKSLGLLVCIGSACATSHVVRKKELPPEGEYRFRSGESGISS
jgi:hypothetical protein